MYNPNILPLIILICAWKGTILAQYFALFRITRQVLFIFVQNYLRQKKLRKIQHVALKLNSCEKTKFQQKNLICIYIKKFKNISRYFRIHENIIIIGDPSKTEMPDRRPIGDLSETHRRPWHASSETRLKPTYPNILFHYIFVNKPKVYNYKNI